MKLLISILLCNLVLTLNAQQKTNCALRIIIADDVEIPQQAVLALNYFDKSEPSLVQLKIEGRTFDFKRNGNEPAAADLQLKWANKKQIRIRFLLPVDTGTILIDKNNKVTINFKTQQALFKGFSEMSDQISRNKQLADAKIKTVNFENRAAKEVQLEIDSVNNHYDKLTDEVYKKSIDLNKDSFLGVYALINYAERPFSHQRRKFETDSLLGLFNSFSDRMKNLPSMQAFYQLLLSERGLVEGAVFPVLKLKDKLDKVHVLNEYYGKYTLIDFWANWCTPCRAENPNVINQYKKYKNEGLVVLSVSIDKAADKYLWLEAITKDGIGLWPNFIDTDKIAEKLLNIRFIPANFLIDSKGKIIAKDLRADELNNKLAEIFKK